jgi:hypothetical protein
MKMVFLIDMQFLDQFQDYQVTEVRINMGEKEGIRTYVFQLHKEALKEQLSCFIKEKERKKKK